MYICILIIISILPILTYQFSYNYNIINESPSQFITHSSISNNHLSHKYRVGIEAHLQLALPNKLFCTCRTNSINNPILSKIKDKLLNNNYTSTGEDLIDFQDYFIKNYLDFSPNEFNIDNLPNKNICNICTGEPGSYGRLNPYAIPMSILAARLLYCKDINNQIIFHRKIYEYIDLPKQYQISQCRNPVARNGFINVSNYGRVSVRQLHLEEDTAKRSNSIDNLDYNRSGIPLLEIVTDPIEANSDEIVRVCREIRRLFRTSGLSMCEMHKGNLRFDINISSPNLNNIIEVKNLNSFERIKIAIDKSLEYGNQILDTIQNISIHDTSIPSNELLSYAITHSPRNIIQKNAVTALWNGKDNFNITRPKSNYLYIQDWTIYPIYINSNIINAISDLMIPENYNVLNKIHVPFNLYPNVNPNILSFIYKDPMIAKYFEACKDCNPQILSTLLVQDYLKVCRANNIKVTESKLTSERFVELVNLVDKNKIDILQARGAIETLALIWDGKVSDIFNIRRFNLLDKHDTKLLVDEFINHSPTRLLNLVTNQDSYIKTIIYEINRMNQGIANPQLVVEYCNQLISNSSN